MRRLQAYVSAEWYWPHAAPIIKALTVPVTVYCPPRVTMDQEAKRFGVDVRFGFPPAPDEVTIVWSGNDVQLFSKVVIADHGVGQSYVSTPDYPVDHPSWAGGMGRDNALLFVVPNEYAAAKNRARYPSIPNVVVGSPHVEYLRTLPFAPNYGVCFSRHWGPALIPEMKSAWWHYESAIVEYARAHPDEVAIHCHPRQEHEGRRCAQMLGLPFLSKFEDVVRSCEVYVADNTSTIFEFAALDRPVVLLGAPWYRPEVEHGGRFWDWAPIGYHCNLESFEEGVTWALDAERRPTDNEIRRPLVAEIFPTIEGSAKLAAEAIEGVLA